ncbi:MAG: hypothetical protein AB1521_03575 [Bacteroidota bacterium]
MKAKIFISIFLVSCLFSSFIFAQNSQIDFPLRIGNRWQYSEGPGYYSESRAIKDTVMPNGLTYTQVTGDLFKGYFRKEGTKVFSYNTFFDTESVKYDFSLKVGYTLQVIIYDSDTTLITVRSAGTANFFGVQRNYMSFFRDNIPSTGDGEETIADGLGLVQYAGEVLYYGLTGAVINSVEYGQILGVENPASTIPDNFRLLQNYPNPFSAGGGSAYGGNPTTTIEYEISTPPSVPPLTKGRDMGGVVTLKVYDILGREVATLVDEYKAPGNYSIQFNVETHHSAGGGASLPSGIYFYTATFNNILKTKSMVLLK